MSIYCEYREYLMQRDFCIVAMKGLNSYEKVICADGLHK